MFNIAFKPDKDDDVLGVLCQKYVGRDEELFGLMTNLSYQALPNTKLAVNVLANDWQENKLESQRRRKSFQSVVVN